MVSRCRIREFSHRSAQKFLPPSITILYYIPGFRTDFYLSLLHIAGVRWLGQGTRDASLRQYYERLCRSCGLTVNSETKWSQLWLIWLCLEYFLPFYTIPMRNRLINQVWFRIHLVSNCNFVYYWEFINVVPVSIDTWILNKLIDSIHLCFQIKLKGRLLSLQNESNVALLMSNVSCTITVATSMKKKVDAIVLWNLNRWSMSKICLICIWWIQNTLVGYLYGFLKSDELKLL